MKNDHPEVKFGKQEFFLLIGERQTQQVGGT